MPLIPTERATPYLDLPGVRRVAAGVIVPWELLEGEPDPAKRRVTPAIRSSPFTAEDAPVLREIDTAISRGLGDDLTALFHRLGADKAAKIFEKVTGLNCGCRRRADWLNKWWPKPPVPPV